MSARHALASSVRRLGASVRGRFRRGPAPAGIDTGVGTGDGTGVGTGHGTGDRLRISYEPALDGDPDPGEVVWGWVPFEEDPTQGKDRPIVVIGRRGRTLVGVPLTSRRDDRDPQVAIGSGAWDRDGRPSYARVDRLVELEPDAVRREGAIVPRDRFDAVVAAVARHDRTDGGG